MSRWVYLNDPLTGEPVPVARHFEGGTYNAHGATHAELNITYNYSALFRWAFDGRGIAEVIDGRRAGDVILDLERAVERLGTERDPDYWAETPGNAGYALSVLLGWARQHPDALFEDRP